MKTTSRLKQLLSESFIYGISGIITKFIAFFLIPIYTRIFVPEDYGVLSLVTNGMMLVSIFVVLALDSAVARWFYDSDDSDKRKQVMATWCWCQLVLSMLITGVIFTFANNFGELLTGKPNSGIYIRVACLYVPLSALGSVVINWLRLMRRAWATVIFSVGISLLTILFTIVFVVFMKTGVIGVFYAQVISATVSTFAAAVLMKGWLNPFRFSFRLLKEMLIYALPLIPGSLSFWVLNLSGPYFIKAYVSTSEVGLYQVGLSIASGVALVTNGFQQAWGPFALSIHKEDNSKQVYADTFLYYMLLTCFCCTALSLFARELLMLLTAKNYYAASSVVGILSFNYMVVGLGYIAVLGASIAKTTKPLGAAIIVSAVFTVILNLLLAPRMGKEGTALAILISQLFVPVYVFFKSQKLYPIPYRFGSGIKICLLSVIISFASTYILMDHMLWVIVTKTALLAFYILLLIWFRLIDAHMLKFISSSLKKTLPKKWLHQAAV